MVGVIPQVSDELQVPWEQTAILKSSQTAESISYTEISFFTSSTPPYRPLCEIMIPAFSSLFAVFRRNGSFIPSFSLIALMVWVPRL